MSRTVCPKVAGIYTSNNDSYTHIRLPQSNPYEFYAVDAFPCDCEGDDLPGFECAIPFKASDFGDYAKPESATGIYRVIKALVGAGILFGGYGNYTISDPLYQLQALTYEGVWLELSYIYYTAGWEGGFDIEPSVSLALNTFRVLKELDLGDIEEELVL